jgi:hypothetical protein
VALFSVTFVPKLVQWILLFVEFSGITSHLSLGLSGMNVGELLEDSKGAPWIARMPWFWAIPISIVTAGAFPLLIGVYLSAWVRSRRSTGFAVYGYGAVAMFVSLEILLEKAHFQTTVLDGVSTAGAILWVTAGFMLRRDLQLYFARPDGDLPQMSVLWTALFSVFYLNYCVWAESDTA